MVPHFIGQFDIELTLPKHRIPKMRCPEKQGWRMNESLLTDDAFLPKTYTARLEKGSFPTTYDAILPEEEGQYTPRFPLRLVWQVALPSATWVERTGRGHQTQ